MPNNFRKYPLKQEQFKDFQVLLYKLKDFQSLGFLFPNSRIFKDFQVLYKPWMIIQTNKPPIWRWSSWMISFMLWIILIAV
jgi:hypothetical protein